MELFSGIYQNRNVLITGHTGFKGSWLSLWLSQMGARISGVALPPETQPNHWELLKLNFDSYYCDICDLGLLADVFSESKPEIVFHLAAQPLVRRSYIEPLTTWKTNVIGTANVLEACRSVPSIKAIIVITTDKCYENKEWLWGYRENDQLGGHDPYSASKAACELLIQSYRKSYFEKLGAPLLASVRAGNVVGGGDWSEDRLIPDLVRSTVADRPLEIRSPHAIRPWQHVLESLSGYLLLGQHLLEGQSDFAEAWNFGPSLSENQSVNYVIKTMQQNWPELKWCVKGYSELHETNLLFLDSVKARHKLRWLPVWNLEKCLEQTAIWYRSHAEERKVLSLSQLNQYIRDAQQSGMAWVK